MALLDSVIVFVISVLIGSLAIYIGGRLLTGVDDFGHGDRAVLQDVDVQPCQSRGVQEFGVGEKIPDGFLGVGGVGETVVRRHQYLCSMDRVLTLLPPLGIPILDPARVPYRSGRFWLAQRVEQRC